MDFIMPSLGTLITPFCSGEPKHLGIDLAIGGNVSVKAAADGIISRSCVSGKYGEVIFIFHELNGQPFETVYAHLRKGSRKFSLGEWVKQGQVIGYMGTTGSAERQHLHFEIHRGKWTASGVNALDPKDYIGEMVRKKKDSGVKLIEIPSEGYWKVYPLDKAAAAGNEIGYLNLRKQAGKRYRIVGNPDRDVYTIITGAFGKINVCGGAESGAKIIDSC